MATQDILFVAGEASGDLHGARLLSALRELEPEVRPFGLGGDELRAAGLDSPAHSSEIAVVGITEAFKVLRRALQLRRALLAEVDRRRPSVAVLIDSAEFNLGLAGALEKRGVRVVYYICPQVWAWRRGRVKKIARRVHRVLVLFPFEERFYREHGVPARHVGHPLVDEVPILPQAWDAPGTPATFEIALLPGSRASEIRSLLPLMLESAGRIAEQVPARFRLVRAATVSAQSLAAPLAAAPVPVEVVSTERFSAMARSHLAICASGTATLEVGLVGTPMLVVYRVSAASALVGRFAVKLPAYSLVNLVLERSAMPELLQEQASPERVATQALAVLRDPARVAAMRADLGELRELLGPPGASRTAAAAVAEVLAEARSGGSAG